MYFVPWQTSDVFKTVINCVTVRKKLFCHLSILSYQLQNGLFPLQMLALSGCGQAPTQSVPRGKVIAMYGSSWCLVVCASNHVTKIRECDEAIVYCTLWHADYERSTIRPTDGWLYSSITCSLLLRLQTQSNHCLAHFYHTLLVAVGNLTKVIFSFHNVKLHSKVKVNIVK